MQVVQLSNLLRILALLCVVQKHVVIGTEADGEGDEALPEVGAEVGDDTLVGDTADMRDGQEFDENDEQPQADDVEDMGETLTGDQIGELHRLMDKDHDGVVTKEEVLETSESMRRAANKIEVQTYMEDLDQNKDGKLSLEEVLKDIDKDMTDGELQHYKAAETKKFEASDINHDGVLDEEEVPKLFDLGDEQNVEQSTREILKEKDVDGDGELNKEEFLNTHPDEEEFNLVDTDHNGKVSATELNEWQSGNLHTRQALEEFIKVVDKNGDGNITQEEMLAAAPAIAEIEAQYHFTEWLDVSHEL
mmetsp:Transcript_31213/g.71259  ORF Transcript_31213/g.71259 Transcript_31213/m.71259 type:complete len:305 (-) Transcript_31213:73-987(-)